MSAGQWLASAFFDAGGGYPAYRADACELENLFRFAMVMGSQLIIGSLGIAVFAFLKDAIKKIKDCQIAWPAAIFWALVFTPIFFASPPLFGQFRPPRFAN
jgi:hypothetical protein